MDIKVKQEVKTKIEGETFFHNGEWKTAPCDKYDWYGNENCRKEDLNEMVNNLNLPEGKYKISITLELLE